MSAGCACKGCDKRHVGCHGECETNRAYRDEIDAVAQKRREEHSCEREYAARKRAQVLASWRKKQNKG